MALLKIITAMVIVILPFIETFLTKRKGIIINVLRVAFISSVLIYGYCEYEENRFEQVEKTEFETERKNERTRDSLDRIKDRDSLLYSYKKGVLNLTDQLGEKNTDEAPELDVIPDYKKGASPLTQLNPLLFYTQHWATSFEVKNVGKATAYNLNDSYVFITFDSLTNSFVTQDNEYYRYVNKGDIISTESPLRITAEHSVKKVLKGSFIAFEVSYTDAKNKRKLLRKIYMVGTNNLLLNADQFQYRDLFSFLKEKHFWK